MLGAVTGEAASILGESPGSTPTERSVTPATQSTTGPSAQPLGGPQPAEPAVPADHADHADHADGPARPPLGTGVLQDLMNQPATLPHQAVSTVKQAVSSLPVARSAVPRRTVEGVLGDVTHQVDGVTNGVLDQTADGVTRDAVESVVSILPGRLNARSGGDDQASEATGESAIDHEPAPGAFGSDDVSAGSVPVPTVPRVPAHEGGSDGPAHAAGFIQHTAAGDAVRKTSSPASHGMDPASQAGAGASPELPVPGSMSLPGVVGVTGHGGGSVHSGGGADLGPVDTAALSLPGTSTPGAVHAVGWRLPGSPSFDSGQSPD
ncbi:MAG: hypothetical protein GEU93_05285 [Propionibacteriales bacterium]|nr:hypothetical protein [Propionibacteriales bacterium]